MTLGHVGRQSAATILRYIRDVQACATSRLYKLSSGKMAETIQNPAQSANAPTHFEEEGIFVALTHDTLDAVTIMNKVRSPKAGAIVLFAGMP